MNLSHELKEAARSFGESLREDEVVQNYLAAGEAVQADTEARELDERSQAMYDGLVERQTAGEQLAREEVRAYQELNRQAQSHPLIAEREANLSFVKTYFVNVALDLSRELGVEYTALAID